MRNTTKTLLMVSALMGISFSAAEANDTPATQSQRWWFDGRLRVETVDQNNGLRDANAITLRSRLGFQTDSYGDFGFLVEAENIFALQDDYNSTTNGQTDRGVVPDPEDTEVNRVQLTYNGFDDTRITLGRQRLLFDNARFIGNVAWRQNEQTFDALSVKNTSLQDTTIEVAYVSSVRRIFGPDSPNGTTDMRSPLIHVQYNGYDKAQVSVYGYFLDFEDAPDNSNQTLGFRIKGNSTVDKLPIDYVVEYARQLDYKSGVDAIDADYVHAGAGVKIGGIRVAIDYELLSGDGTYGFQTPLATAHAFNGWADLFLTTPAEGLADINVSVNAVVKGTKLRAVYHQFDADTGSQNYGSEINFIATRKFGERLSAGLKFADYSADERGVDTTKFWMWAGVKY
ncbi:MAG: hypothetical protein AAF004_15125 [Pseudomonadota bacterium]